MRRVRVYIAGPITKGDLAHNVNQATAAFVALAKAGYAPFCPHWSVYENEAVRGYVAAPDGQLSKHVYAVASVNGNPAMSHEDWIGVDLAWVEAADALLRLPGESAGADAERDHAMIRGIPVFYSLDALMTEADRFFNTVAAVGESADAVRGAVDKLLSLVAAPCSQN